MAIVEELIGRLGFQTSGLGQATQFQQKIEGIKSSMNGLKLLATGAVAVALGSFGKSVIATGAQFERFGIQLESLEGSAEKGRKAMAWIQDFAVRTPLELDGVVESYVRLKAFGLDPTNGSLQAMVDTMAQSGKGQAALEGIITAVGQAWTKQKLQGEEAMQLLERGVPVWDLLSEAMGKTVPQIQEMATKGKLGRKEIQLLINAMGKKAAGASDKMAESLDGLNSQLTDLYTNFKLRIANSGFFDAWKNLVRDFRDGFNSLSADGSLDRWAQSLSNIGVSGINSFRRFKGALSDLVSFVRTNANIDILKLPLFAGLMFAATRFPIAGAVIGTIAVLDDFVAWFRNEEHLIPWDRMTNLESLKGLVREIEGELTRTAGAVDRLIEKHTGLKPFDFTNIFDPAQGQAAMAQTVGQITEAGLVKWEEYRVKIADKIKSIESTILNAFKIDLTGQGEFTMLSFLEGLVRGAERVMAKIREVANSIREGLSGITIQAPHMTVPGGKAGPPVKRDFSKDGMSDPANPGIKKGASLDRALARTQLASVAPGVRGGAGNRTFADNSHNEVHVHVAGTNATPNQIAATTQRALQSSKNLHFQGATNPAVV